MGHQKITLTDVKEIHRFSKTFAWVVTILYLLGSLPFAAMTMIAKEFWLPFPVARFIVGGLGFLTMFRAFFGASFFVKFMFAMEFLLAKDKDVRDDMGRSMREDRIRYMVFYCSLVGACSVGLVCGTYYYDSQLRTFAAAVCGGVIAGIYGMFLAQMQGLPAAPQFFLTVWPNEGHFVQYERKFQCPCIFYFAECSEMHSRVNMLVLYLDNMQSYQGLLKGEADMGTDQ